jgi:hypothetical protein
MTEKGPLKNIRNGIFGLLGRSGSRVGKGKDSLSLPVGVPPGFQPEFRFTGSGSSSANEQKMQDLEEKLNSTTKKVDLYKKAVSHSNNLLDGLLFPMQSEKNATTNPDIFTFLTESDGWFQNATTLPSGASNNEHPVILRSCAAELSIDYCTRVSSRETSAYVEELSLIPDDQPFPTMDEIEQHLVDVINATEPYCALIETCIMTNFESVECRPKTCPFTNNAACSYLQSCFGPDIQNEYALALGLINEGESLSSADLNGLGVKSEATAGQSENSSVGGWGIPTTN